jgi:hypothetical protein
MVFEPFMQEIVFLMTGLGVGVGVAEGVGVATGVGTISSSPSFKTLNA